MQNAAKLIAHYEVLILLYVRMVAVIIGDAFEIGRGPGERCVSHGFPVFGSGFGF